MEDCSTLWARGRQSYAGPPTSVLLAGRRIQSMPAAVEDVLKLSLQERRILADVEVRRHGCISIRGPQSWKWSFATPEASGGCVGLEWCGTAIVLQTLNEPQYSVLQPFYLSVSYFCQQSIAVVQPTMYKGNDLKRLLSEIVVRALHMRLWSKIGAKFRTFDPCKN